MSRWSAPAACRNMDVICTAYQRLMPHCGDILEIACGSGEHGCAIARACQDLTWHPTDLVARNCASANAWRSFHGLSNIAQAKPLDVTEPLIDPQFNSAKYDGLFCVNMVHIAPIAVSCGLFRIADLCLKPGAPLFLYGPFSRNSQMVPSNARFHDWLKAQNSDWGIRDLDQELVPIAQQAGFALTLREDVPANNMICIFTKNG